MDQPRHRRRHLCRRLPAHRRAQKENDRLYRHPAQQAGRIEGHRQPVLFPAHQPEHQRAAAGQQRPATSVPAFDGRIYQHRQGGNHCPFRQLHGRLQHPPVSDYPIRRPTGRRLRQRIRPHDHHQPRAANHLYAEGAAGCERVLGNAGLYHGETEERQPRTRTQHIGKRGTSRADAAAGIERNESGQRNHPLRRHGTSGEGEQDSLLSGWNVHQTAEEACGSGFVEGQGQTSYRCK